MSVCKVWGSKFQPWWISNSIPACVHAKLCLAKKQVVIFPQFLAQFQAEENDHTQDMQNQQNFLENTQKRNDLILMSSKKELSCVYIFPKLFWLVLHMKPLSQNSVWWESHHLFSIRNKYTKERWQSSDNRKHFRLSIMKRHEEPKIANINFTQKFYINRAPVSKFPVSFYCKNII